MNGNQEAATQRQILESTGKHYYEFRAALMVKNNEGLTTTYNRFHDSEEIDSQVMELRRLHGEMDQAVLNAYGWHDVPTGCGFGLDYLDVNDDVSLPPELQKRIDSGDLFFRDADEACDFAGQLQAVTGSRRKLSWRYRWPDAVREDVLARLLALNAERYAQEVAQGLHSGKKKAAKASGKPGKRRGRPPEESAACRGWEPGSGLMSFILLVSQLDAIALACRRHHVARMHLFGWPYGMISSQAVVIWTCLWSSSPWSPRSR